MLLKNAQGPIADRYAYRRGQILGLTIAEFFLVLAFILLLLLAMHLSRGIEEQRRIDALTDAMESKGLSMTTSEILDMFADAEEWKKSYETMAGQLDEAETELAELQRELVPLKEIADAVRPLGNKLPPDFIELVRQLARQYKSDGTTELTPEEVVSLISEITEQWTASNYEIGQQLLSEFEGDLDGWQAEIDTGQLVFRFTDPEVLFTTGSEELRPRFQSILINFCPRFLSLLAEYKEHIAEIRIEGHTSSEWGAEPPLAAYFHNMELSQARTREVLEFCLEQQGVRSIGTWPESILVAVGMSSSRLKYNDAGAEDQEASRRVELRIVTDADRQIGEIIETLKTQETQE